jgi:maleate isomerase
MRRVGLIVPSGNVVIEDMLQSPSGPARKDVRFHVTRLPVVAIDMGSESRDQFSDAALDEAVGQLLDADIDAIVFAGTAGAWLGIARDRDWAARTRDATGLPATTTTLQALAALGGLRSDRLGLITPFVQEVHDSIAGTLAAEGFPVAYGRHLGLSLGREMAEVPPVQIAEIVGACVDAGCDAVLTFCTNFRGLEAFRLKPAANCGAMLLDSVALTFDELPP